MAYNTTIANQITVLKIQDLTQINIPFLVIIEQMGSVVDSLISEIDFPRCIKDHLSLEEQVCMRAK